MDGIDLTSLDVDRGRVAQALRHVAQVFRAAVPGAPDDLGIVERVTRGAVLSGIRRLEVMTTLIESNAPVEVGLAARLLYDTQVSIEYIHAGETQAEKLERARRFEAWDGFQLTRVFREIDSDSSLAPEQGFDARLAVISETYPRMASLFGQLDSRELERQRAQIVSDFPEFPKSRTWSGKTLREMACAVAKGAASSYGIVYPMLSLFGHASPWSIELLEEGPSRALGLIVWGLAPLQSYIAVASLWPLAFPEVVLPVKRSDLVGLWAPEDAKSTD